MTTIGERLAARRGIAPGFDFLRLFLALSVVAWHVPPLIGRGIGHDEAPVLWLFGYSILAAFFGLSGFLIAGSAQRLTLPAFLTNRGLRIFPALMVEILLSALVLGPIFTTLTLWAYFGSGQTWHYFTNMIGIINYRLPGVFETHPLPLVNMTLWTVPLEIYCYVLMSIFMVVGMLKHRLAVLGVAVFMIALGLGLEAVGVNLETRADLGPLGRVGHDLFVSQGSRLFVAFVLGIAAYLYRDRIPYSPRLMLAAAIWCAALSVNPILSTPLANLLVAPVILYLTACIGVTDVPLPSLLRRHDYSYGIYLYGFPMQQMVFQLAPPNDSLLFNFLAVLPLIFLFSAFSWHMIERPILQLRKKFSFISRVRLTDDGPGSAPEAASAPASPVASTAGRGV